MRNKFAILVSAVLISVSAFAQKDELKTLKKLYDKDQLSDKDITEYKAALTKAETFLSGAAEADVVYINFYKGMLPILEANTLMSKPENQTKPELAQKFINAPNLHNLATSLNATLDFEKKSGKAIYTKDIQETVESFSEMILGYAIALGNAKKYSEGASVLYDLYTMDKTKPDNLYYAASYAVNALDYDMALRYYDELKAIKYSGEATTYVATSTLSGKEENFKNKADRDKMVLLKTYTKPREEKVPSKRGEIYKNIALILVQKGKTDEAKAAFAEALKENPDDVSLMINEADLYLKLKDNEAYKQKINKVLEKKPNDADLIYNIGVVTMEGGQLTEAESYFNKAIAIDPKHINSYMNMSVLKLKADEKLVTDMNKLGTSEKDNKKYEVLKKERETLFKNALPYLEKANELDPENQAVINSLISVYNFLEQTDTPRYKALKAKRK